ncbi:MAG TPA: secretin N-terminal domain-containing protein [Methylococcaceae bacterium]|nr:secretin N-terminal domain-containing protein [Methylococcaceae bacterium]
MRRALIFLLFLVGAAGADEMATLPLHHRQADEVVELLRPLLEPGEVIVPNRFSLIVRASPQRIAEIRELLRQLDKRSHRLIIHVRQSGVTSAEELNAAARVQGRIDAGDFSESRVRIQGRIRRGDTRESADNTQQVQTLEGQPARIQMGETRAVPAPGNVVIYGGGHAVVAPGLQYQDLTTGFAVLPRLTGSGEVQLEISPWSDTADPRYLGGVRTREATTSVQVRLGEWVEIGGQTTGQTSEQDRLLGHAYRTSRENVGILLMVEDVDAGLP